MGLYGWATLEGGYERAPWDRGLSGLKLMREHSKINEHQSVECGAQLFSGSRRETGPVSTLMAWITVPKNLSYFRSDGHPAARLFWLYASKAPKHTTSL